MNEAVKISSLVVATALAGTSLFDFNSTYSYLLDLESDFDFKESTSIGISEEVEKIYRENTLSNINKKCSLKKGLEKFYNINGYEYNYLDKCNRFIDFIFGQVNPSGKNILTFSDDSVSSTSFIDDVEMEFECYFNMKDKVFAAFTDEDDNFHGRTFKIDSNRDSVCNFIKNV